jgi:molecular chaperone GrpE
MTAVLPILDDMDRALEAMSKTEDADNCRQGFELIANKFRTTLEQNGLREIEAKGEPFDTDYHEAIAMVPASDEMPKGQVIDCVQKGYKLNDRVIRHSKVVVAN